MDWYTAGYLVPLAVAVAAAAAAVWRRSALLLAAALLLVTVWAGLNALVPHRCVWEWGDGALPIERRADLGAIARDIL